MLDLLTFQITFKNEQNSYFDIILKFEENNKGRKKTIDIIEYLEIEDIQKWIQYNDLNLTSDFIREFNIFKCKFKLTNKPFNSNIKYEEANFVSPNIRNNSNMLGNKSYNGIKNNNIINNDLVNQLKIEEEKNNNLIKEINRLKKEINTEKEKINKLTKDLNLEKEKNINLNSKINLYIKTNDQLNIKINSLQSELDVKKTEIDEINNKLKVLNGNSNLKYINPGEEIMAIHFISTDAKVNYAFPCKNTDIFVKLEEKLYDEYPQYKEFNYFLQ